MVYTPGEGWEREKGGGKGEGEGKREEGVVVFKTMCTNTCMTTRLGRGSQNIPFKGLLILRKKKHPSTQI